MMPEMNREERTAFREMAAGFARRSVGPLLRHESPDGELEKLGAVLAEAEATGLLASPDPEAPGHATGVWGRDTLEHGPRMSLSLLEELAVACAGVAMNLHAAGLGSLLLAGAPAPAGARRVAVALSEGGFPPGARVIMDPGRMEPARIETAAAAKDGGYVLRGRKDFVHQALDTDAYIVFARMEEQWAAFLVRADAAGLRIEPAGQRQGLRACPVVDLILKDVSVPAEARLDFGRPAAEAVMEFMRLWSLGLVAIGAGTARGALAAARVYAHERYQGGAEIIHHSPMGALLAEAEAGIMVCEGLLERAVMERGRPGEALRLAAKARLMGMPAAALAVSNCLQVFGGYGYMEDYRMEKRYRDVNTLKSAGGGQRELRRLIAELGEED